VDTHLFAKAVDRVSAISTEKSRAVKLTISKGNLMLSASSADNDTATEELKVDYDSTEIEIGFNSRYLLDIAQQIEGDRARFTLADAASPTLVQDLDDQGAIYVLMPMRV
jgi:DNA polymerase-3 subunit beta